MGKTGMFDLEKQFAYYSAYHRDPVNILIHNFVVWPIFFTFQLLLWFTPSLCRLDAHPALVLNLGLVFTLIHAFCYVWSDKRAGSFAAFLCFLSWVAASSLAASIAFPLACKIVLGVQLVSWSGQVFGHGVYEKRAPARNLLQAAVMAPFFVLLEVFQTSFAYEPYPGFAERVKEQVQAEIKEWHQKQEKKFT